MLLKKISYSVLFLGLVLITVPRAFADEEQDLVKHTLEYDGKTRSYLVYVPPQVRDSNIRVPLVIVLHGGGGNGRKIAATTGFTQEAKNNGFIVIYPDGSGRRGDFFLTWNARHCCAYAMRNDIDDVGFIRSVIDRMVQDYPVDAARVYVTGASNGALMTNRLAIELSGKIAAIAPVVGTLFGDEEQPSMPVPALIINGALDQHILKQGGKSSVGVPGAFDDVVPLPVASQGDFWAKANGCNPTPQKQAPTQDNPVTVWRYSCPSGNEVVRYLVMDQGHAWPGGKPNSRGADMPSQAMNATDVIWNFFKTHSRQ